MKKTEVNDYTYTIYDNGTVTAEGNLQDAKASRNGMQHLDVGGSAKEPGDQKGHLIAARANGAAVKENLFAQNGNLNQGTYKKMENAEMHQIRDNSARIYTEKTAFVSNKAESGMRPDAYMVHDTITYADGQVQHVNLSFANMSSPEQMQLNEISSPFSLESADNPGDVLRAEMTEAEYAALMEQTDECMPNINDEFMEQVEVSYDYDSLSIVSEQEAECDVSVGLDIGDDGSISMDDE